MTTEWVITAAAERVDLRDGAGETTFLVTNPSSAQDRVVFEVVAGDGADPSWLRPPEEPQVLVAAGGSASFLVKIAVPAGAAAGGYWLQGRAYSADTAPEEGSRLSGRVAFQVMPSVKPKKPWWPYALAAGLILVVVLVAGILVLGGDDEPQAQSPAQPTTVDTSVTPVLLSPADGAIFDIYPRTTVYAWQAVPGATSYRIEIQYCPATGCTDADSARWKLRTVTDTSFTDNFVGAQPGRWRITAVLPSGDGGTSDWRQFRHLR
jgi:hypothetical protein